MRATHWAWPMTRIELARLAAAAAVLRPDWPEPSLRTFLDTHLAHRPYHDVAVALTFVATDPDTRTPARVLEAGPWWTNPAIGATTTPNDCATHPTAAVRVDPVSGKRECAGCHSDRHGVDQPEPVSRGGRPPTPEQRQQLVAAIHRATQSGATATCAAASTCEGGSRV